MFRFSVILFFARLRINACWSKCFRYFFSYSFMVRLAFLRWWYIIRGVNVLLFFLCLFWCLHHFLTFAAVSPPGLPCWNLNLPTRGCVGKILPRFPVRKQGRFETPFPFPMVSSKPFRFYAGVFDCGLFFGFLWPCFWVAFFWDFSCWRFKGRYFPLVDAIFFANPIIQSVI